MAHIEFDFREHCSELSETSQAEIEVDCLAKQGEYCDGKYRDERLPAMDRQAEIRADDERAARLFRDLFEIFASRFLREGRLSETLVDTLLPELAARAAFRGKWVSDVYEPAWRAANVNGKDPFSREQGFVWHFRRYGYFSKYLGGATDHWKALAKRARVQLTHPEQWCNTAEAERGQARRTWMEERHPGWSIPEWERHTEAACHKVTYKTLQKWKAGVTTRKTPDIRNSLSKSEGVSFQSVPP